MKIDQVAAQLFTLRDFMQTPDDIKKSLKKVKDIGYKAVQVSALGPIDPKLLKEMTDELGLIICVTHMPYDRFKMDLDNLIKEHKIWECTNMGIGSMPEKFRYGRSGFEQFIEEFSEIGEKLSDNGIRLVYHNHKFEFEKFDGETGMDILLNNSDPAYFDFEIDTYWVQAGGADPVEWIDKVNGRMEVVHLKDMMIKNDEQIFAEIGQGNLNWTRIMDACKMAGVKWYAVEQDSCLGDPFGSLKISFEYLKSMGD